MADSAEMVSMSAKGNSVPILFSVGVNYLAIVLALRLCTRFHLQLDSLHVDEEVFNGKSGALLHTIGCATAVKGADRSWQLKVGKYRACGIADLDRLESTQLVLA